MGQFVPKYLSPKSPKPGEMYLEFVKVGSKLTVIILMLGNSC